MLNLFLRLRIPEGSQKPFATSNLELDFTITRPKVPSSQLSFLVEVLKIHLSRVSDKVSAHPRLFLFRQNPSRRFTLAVLPLMAQPSLLADGMKFERLTAMPLPQLHGMSYAKGTRKEAKSERIWTQSFAGDNISAVARIS